MTDEKRLAMLKWRDGIVDLVLDTDAATEVDDPFAIAYLLLSPERFRLQAIYAAPFAMNERTQDPAEGMEMSYEEILHIMRWPAMIFRTVRMFIMCIRTGGRRR